MGRVALPNNAKYRTSLGTALRGLRHASWDLRVITDAGRDAPPGPRPAPGVLSPIASRLRADVTTLATRFAGRNIFRPWVLSACEAYLVQRLRESANGLAVGREAYVCRGVEVANLVVDVTGSVRPDEVVVVGAHYDAVELRERVCPAANDNASGVAVTLMLLALVRGWKTPPERTLRFVLWPNEEPPFFWTEQMGSLVHADATARAMRRARERGEVPERIVGMITPETIAYRSREEDSQGYPLQSLLAGNLPTRGDFVAMVGMTEAAGFVARCAALFRASCSVPCLSAALPGMIPHVGASDHWSYWRHGWPALMVTDTAPYRYRWYHTPEDTPEKLDFAWSAEVTLGLEGVLRGVGAIGN